MGLQEQLSDTGCGTKVAVTLSVLTTSPRGCEKLIAGDCAMEELTERAQIQSKSPQMGSLIADI